MPDRLWLPDDRHEACRACSSEKRIFLCECEDCGKSICSQCCVEARNDVWSTSSMGLCRHCAIKRLNEELVPLVPICTCEGWPSWVRYGQQLPLEAA